MSFIQKWRLYFHHQYLQKELKATKKERKRVNFNSAKTIGLLFEATNTDNREACIAYAETLKERRKRVSLLGYFDSNQQNSNFVFRHFNRKDFDWALRPSNEEVQEFIQQPFDLLINLDPVSKLHAEYIAALSKAHLRIGPSTPNTYSFDLMIDTSGSKDLQQFIQQMEFLLQKTNTNNEAA